MKKYFSILASALSVLFLTTSIVFAGMQSDLLQKRRDTFGPNIGGLISPYYDLLEGDVGTLSTQLTAQNIMQQAVVSLTATQINHLFSAPLTVLAIPGTGKMIHVVDCEWDNHVGTIPTGSTATSAGNILLTYNSASGLITCGDAGAFNALVSSTTQYPSVLGLAQSAPAASAPILTASPALVLYTSITNKALVLSNSVEDYANYGTILTKSVTGGHAGTGYAINDTGTISGGSGDSGGVKATYTVNTVSSGAVATFTITTQGSGGYHAGSTGNATTVSTGTGDGGFQINIPTVTPGNGSGQLTILYYVDTLP